MLQEQPHFYDRHITVNKILNRNGFGEGNDTNQGRHVSNIFIFKTVTNNIDQKQIKYHVFDAVTNSELTELVPVFTIRAAFPTSVKKVNFTVK